MSKLVYDTEQKVWIGEMKKCEECEHMRRNIEHRVKTEKVKIISSKGEQERTEYRCPECDNVLRKYVGSNKYCPECGSKLDWSEVV